MKPKCKLDKQTKGCVGSKDDTKEKNRIKQTFLVLICTGDGSYLVYASLETKKPQNIHGVVPASYLVCRQRKS